MRSIEAGNQYGEYQDEEAERDGDEGEDPDDAMAPALENASLKPSCARKNQP